MSRIFYNSQSQPIQLSHKLGTGGEGSVYEIFGQSDFVAKIYHEPPEPEKADKLVALSKLSNERLLKLAAWPVDVLRVEAGGQLAGFIMKKIGQAEEVHTLHSPKSRLRKFPEASWAFLIYVAANIARAVATVHEHDFIVGDLNPKNILVTHQATVALLDCDSFQVTTDGKTFRCEGGFPEYLPPELQGQSLREIERKPKHDHFGLAVVIFQLLFMGRHPFSGKFLGEGELTLEEAIRKHRFAFGEDAAARQMQQPPGTLSLAAIPASLNNLFRRAFLSADRPQPLEWIEPLETLAKSLKSCELHSGHQFFNELTECPWCEIEMRARIRLFNFSLNGQSGKRSHFRLDQIWSEVEKLEAEPVSLALAEIKKDLILPAKPSPQATEFARARYGRLIQSVIFAAAAGFAIGFFVSWPWAIFLAILAGAAAKYLAAAEFNPHIQVTNFTQRRFAAADSPFATEVEQKLESTTKTVQQLEYRLEKVSVANNFQPKLEELQNRKKTYEHLPQIREYRLKQLESKAQEQQLSEFLDQFKIVEVDYSIDPWTKSRLRLHGIETAADLTPERLKQIPDVSETQAQRLLFWRAEKKRQFAFDPARDNLPQARITAERELDNLRMQLEHELTAGAMFLQRLKKEMTVHQQELSAALPDAYREQAQTERDWEAVSKRNPMWPIAVILIVSFIYGSFVSVYFDEQPNTAVSPVQSTTDSSTAKEETELSPEQTEARFQFEKGEEEMKQEKWGAAAKLFQRATVLDPQFQPAYTQLGYVLYRQGKYDESIEISTRATRIQDEFEPNFYLGLAYKAKKQWEPAADSFIQAITLNKDPEDSKLADAYYYLGQSLQKTGQINDAIKALEDLEKSDLIKAADRFELATLYLWAGKHKQAEEQHTILKNWDETLARHLQRLIKQHRRG